MTTEVFCDPARARRVLLRSTLRCGVALGVAAILGSVVPASAQAVRGVSDTEIVIGTHLSMSGPLAAFGAPVAEGMRMRFDEANEKGGVFGRKIRLIVEDNQFNPARAAQVGNKLLHSDNVFAILGALGTPTNVVVMEEAFKLNVPNLFPNASGRQMFEPFHRLKFAFQSPHYDNLRNATKFLVETKRKKTVCTLVQDNEFGKEIAFGAETQLKAMGMAVVAQATHRSDDKDFSAQLSKLRSANCDLVVLGTVVADTIGIMATARRMDWKVDFVGSSSPVTPETITLAQGATDGLYATSQFAIPSEDAGSAFSRDWFSRYSKRYGHPPGFPAVSGYVEADLLITGLTRAGKSLSVDTLVGALEALQDYRDPFQAGPSISFSATKRLGTNQSFLVQVQQGRWVKASETLSY
jgi:branched-chain amino acid transport system substrate-binding protein